MQHATQFLSLLIRLTQSCHSFGKKIYLENQSENWEKWVQVQIVFVKFIFHPILSKLQLKFIAL